MIALTTSTYPDAPADETMEDVEFIGYDDPIEIAPDVEVDLPQ